MVEGEKGTLRAAMAVSAKAARIQAGRRAREGGQGGRAFGAKRMVGGDPGEEAVGCVAWYCGRDSLLWSHWEREVEGPEPEGEGMHVPRGALPMVTGAGGRAEAHPAVPRWGALKGSGAGRQLAQEGQARADEPEPRPREEVGPGE